MRIEFLPHCWPLGRLGRCAIGAVIVASAIASIFLGIEFSDTGFVQGLGYRVFLGQQPYVDFDYVRPPLTPWLWQWPFPRRDHALPAPPFDKLRAGSSAVA